MSSNLKEQKKKVDAGILGLLSASKTIRPMQSNAKKNYVLGESFKTVCKLFLIKKEGITKRENNAYEKSLINNLPPEFNCDHSDISNLDEEDYDEDELLALRGVPRYA